MKYVKLLMMLRDVSLAYEAEKGHSRPAYVSRSFIGALFLAIAFALRSFKGIAIDEATTGAIAENVYTIVDAAFGIWGAIMCVVGVAKSSHKDRTCETTGQTT